MAAVTSTPGLRVVDAMPSMATEDFASMLERMPGSYVWLGAAEDGANPGLHSQAIDFNDVVLGRYAKVWMRLVGDTLAVARDIRPDTVAR